MKLQVDEMACCQTGKLTKYPIEKWPVDENTGGFKM